MILYYCTVTHGHAVFCCQDWLRSVPGGLLKKKMLSVVTIADAGKQLAALHKYLLASFSLQPSLHVHSFFDLQNYSIVSKIGIAQQYLSSE